MNTSKYCGYCGITISKLLQEYLITHDFNILYSVDKIKHTGLCSNECAAHKLGEYYNE